MTTPSPKPTPTPTPGPWYALPNDLVGGWCVVSRTPTPPSQIDFRHTDPDAPRIVAECHSEEDARLIAAWRTRLFELHDLHRPALPPVYAPDLLICRECDKPYPCPTIDLTQRRDDERPMT